MKGKISEILQKVDSESGLALYMPNVEVEIHGLGHFRGEGGDTYNGMIGKVVGTYTRQNGVEHVSSSRTFEDLLRVIYSNVDKLSGTHVYYWLQHPEDFKIPVLLSPDNIHPRYGKTLGEITVGISEGTVRVSGLLEVKLSIRNLKIYNRAAIEKKQSEERQ